MKDEKLQKALARMGLGSRRQMEEVIKAGRVTVNNGPATIGDRVEQGDEIRVDGRQIKYTAENEKRRRVLAYYKPKVKFARLMIQKVVQRFLNVCQN